MRFCCWMRYLLSFRDGTGPGFLRMGDLELKENFTFPFMLMGEILSDDCLHNLFLEPVDFNFSSLLDWFDEKVLKFEFLDWYRLSALVLLTLSLDLLSKFWLF